MIVAECWLENRICLFAAKRSDAVFKFSVDKQQGFNDVFGYQRKNKHKKALGFIDLPDTIPGTGEYPKYLPEGNVKFDVLLKTHRDEGHRIVELGLVGEVWVIRHIGIELLDQCNLPTTQKALERITKPESVMKEPRFSSLLDKAYHRSEAFKYLVDILTPHLER